MIACRPAAPPMRPMTWSCQPAWRGTLAEVGFWVGFVVLLLALIAAVLLAWFPVMRGLAWAMLWCAHVTCGYPPPPDYRPWEAW